MKINIYKKIIFSIVLFISILAMSMTTSKAWYFMDLPDGSLGVENSTDDRSPIYYSEEGTYYCITKGSPFSSSFTNGHYQVFIKKLLQHQKVARDSWHELVFGERRRILVLGTEDSLDSGYLYN